MPTNRRIVQLQRPQGTPGPAIFSRDDQPTPELADGQFLLRNHYLSIDPAQRAWISAGANYADPVPVGGVRRSLAVGAVAASRNEEFAVGEYLYGWFGWQDYCAPRRERVVSFATCQRVLVEAAMTDEPMTSLPYVDRPELQEIYADQIRLTHFDGYSVRLEFAVVRPHLAGPGRAESTLYPAARLALSPHAAISLKDQLVQLVAMLEQQGVLRRITPASTAKQ